MQFKPFVVRTSFDHRDQTERQKLDLIELINWNVKIQMYGHNADNLCHPQMLIAAVLV